jgi:anthranilate synthase
VSELFGRVQRASPSPYEFLLQFGEEQLVGASPEMFVRVEGHRVETCPISGTAQRTGDPLRDADNIRELLKSAKEESELTMCTDVDRNDKSRVCEPGTVRVIGRRLIESYAGVFHTVDHVEGIIQEGFDALDAFLSHMWAVTVIGAPKKAAAQVVEALVRRRRGNDLAQWRYQHRNPDSHHVSAGRGGVLSGWGDAALRFHSRDGRARNAAQGYRLFPRAWSW